MVHNMFIYIPLQRSFQWYGLHIDTREFPIIKLFSFVKLSSKPFHSQTVSARELKFFEKVHLPKPVTGRMSHVTFHMSHVMCQIFLSFLDKVVKLFGGGSVFNGAYPI